METNNSIHPKMYMYKRIVDAKLFIDQHYAEKIDLDAISQQGNFSKYHFLRLFKNAFGKSPHSYLTEVRLLHAQRLLKENKSIADVCIAVGFESTPSFISLFKKHTGETPAQFVRQFRKQNLQKQATPFAFVPACFAEGHGWKE